MFPTHLELPLGGSVVYEPSFFALDEAHERMLALRAELPWRQEEVVMFGKRLTLEREVVWCADEDLSYTYSGKTKFPTPWSSTLQEIREALHRATGASFNACLLNYYPDGSQGMSWHSDDEASLVQNSTIASFSLGAQRKFVFKPKSGGSERYTFELASGSLLLMKGAVQKHYLHALPKSKKVLQPRMNLTFRQMVPR